MQNTEFAAVSPERDDQVEHLYLDAGGPTSQRLLIPSAQPASNESNFHTQTVSSVMAYWGRRVLRSVPFGVSLPTLGYFRCRA